MKDILNEVLTLKEVSQIYNKSDKTLRANIKNGKFIENVDCRKSGGTWIILKSALEREYGK